MSRRDEVVDTLDSLVSNFRSQLQTAIQQHNAGETTTTTSRNSSGSNTPTNGRLSRSRAPSIVSRLSSLLIEPPTSVTPQQEGGGGVPFSSSRHTSIPLPPVGHSPSLPLTRNDDDSLPSYSRTAPISPNLISTLPPKRFHLLTSRSSKLSLSIPARGSQHVILIQELPDSSTLLSGTLTLNLPNPPGESISHLKIRLKGIVRTLVMKSHASGRHPVSDELTFLQDSKTLYNCDDPETSFLPGRNESVDPTKLVGIFKFPFELKVPSRITHYSITSLPGNTINQKPIPLSTPIRPPPSFMLDSQTIKNKSPSSVISTQSPGGGGFEVSIRYFLKVTLGRKSLLKMNERWIIPLVFVPRQNTPTISPGRYLALEQYYRQGQEEGSGSSSLRVPHSDQDPQGWTLEGKYKMKRSFKKPQSTWGGSLKRGGSSGVADISIEGKTIRGNKIERGDAGSPGGKGLVPFEVTVKTSSVKITGKFKPNMINVFLVQRTIITAQQRLSNQQDLVVAKATSMHPFRNSDPEGESWNEGLGWRVDFGGNIQLPSHLGVSFKAPNLSITYVLCFSINVGGISNDLSPLTIPIELINCPPRNFPSLLIPPPPPPLPSSSSSPPPPPPISPLPPRLNELAPPPPPPTASSSTGENLPPRLPPRHPSISTSTTTSSTVYLPLSNTTSGGAVVPRGVNRGGGERESSEEEDELLESIYGLPPSYFDTVEMDQQQQQQRRHGGGGV
ncbi:hypothetical protein JCM5350_004816 [Sporobolomyces pararoseus]